MRCRSSGLRSAVAELKRLGNGHADSDYHRGVIGNWP